MIFEISITVFVLFFTLYMIGWCRAQMKVNEAIDKDMKTIRNEIEKIIEVIK